MAEEAEKKQKKKFNIKDVAILGIIIALVLMILTGTTVEDIGNGLDDFLNGNEQEPVVEKPADLELYKFNDLVGNKTLNVEIWLLNTGDKTAVNITLHLRVRNQNGILFDGFITPSTLALRENESNTACYTISTVNSTQIIHTIEISWNEGRKVYSKITDI